MRSLKSRLAAAIAAARGSGPGAPAIEPSALVPLFSTPPDRSLGDLALPCFTFAKAWRKDPKTVAAEIAATPLGVEGISGASAAGPYVNFRYDRPAFARAALAEVRAAGEGFGRSDAGAGKTVVVDYSSPNIAKHLAVHHLRSTMLGQAMVNILRLAGFTVVGINHLGDWGTTFGKLLSAMERFGAAEGLDREPLAAREDPIATLNALYTRFHAEAEHHPHLEEEARRWFRRLEEGDPVARERWSEIRELSLARYQRVYDRLGVRFDQVIGESFFEDRMPAVIAELSQKGLLEESDDAQVVRVGDDIPPFLVRKKDGTTLYGTRDLAAVKYRAETWRFDRALYVVDAGQSLHFRQLFAVAAKLGWECAPKLEHAAFGVMRLPVDGAWVKGRTRHGVVVLLEEVLDSAVARAREIVRAKNPDLEEPDRVAEAVGVGAVVFSDLKARRIKDVNFDLEKILSFEGETGPYLQFTHVRFAGIVRKSGGLDFAHATGERLVTDEDLALLEEILRFPETVERAAAEAEPSVVGQYLLSLAATFNHYYAKHRVLDDDPAVAADRLALVDILRVTLASGLRALGIVPLERM